MNALDNMYSMLYSFGNGKNEIRDFFKKNHKKVSVELAYNACMDFSLGLPEFIKILKQDISENAPVYAIKAWENLGLSPEFCISIIENAENGDLSRAALYAYRYMGMPKWKFLKILKRDKSGTPAEIALEAEKNLIICRERAFRIIENAKTGNPVITAFKAHIDLGMKKKRVRKVLKKWGKENDFDLDMLI